MGNPAYLPFGNPALSTMPQPPRLHWGWVLLLSALTRSVFGIIWLFVQANWIRKATGRSEPKAWALAHLCALPAIFVFGLLVGRTPATAQLTADAFQKLLVGFGVFAALAVSALYLVTVFKLRTALEEEPIGIPLGGVMTLFFGPIYFQYFLRDYVPLEYGQSGLRPTHTYPIAPPQA